MLCFAPLLMVKCLLVYRMIDSKQFNIQLQLCKHGNHSCKVKNCYPAFILSDVSIVSVWFFDVTTAAVF